MFLSMFFNVFIKVKKHVFNVFYLQIYVSNIYGCDAGLYVPIA